MRTWTWLVELQLRKSLAKLDGTWCYVEIWMIVSEFIVALGGLLEIGKVNC